MKFVFKYFPHDISARCDLKLRALEAAMGANVGYGMYFKLLEVLAQSNGVIDINREIARNALALELSCDLDTLQAFLDTCAELNLIAAHRYTDGRITSEGFNERLQEMERKILAADAELEKNRERQQRFRNRKKEAKEAASS